MRARRAVTVIVRGRTSSSCFWTRRSVTLVAGAICLAIPAHAGAQVRERFDPAESRQGTLPDAVFEVMFQKYTPPANAFTPFYAWDAHMAMDLTIFRRGSWALAFGSLFQSVGTENFGSRVSVGGTGYLFGFSVARAWSSDFKLVAGISHLSSHLTRDLDEKLEEERNKGTVVPDVVDPDEYNVVFLKAALRFPTRRFTPEVEAIVHPVNIRFGGGLRGGVRPLHLRSRVTLWRSGASSVAVETMHEVGPDAFNHASLLFERGRLDQRRSRFQIFLSAAPGHQLHVSPDVGGLRDGLSLGVRISAGT